MCLCQTPILDALDQVTEQGTWRYANNGWKTSKAGLGMRFVLMHSKKRVHIKRTNFGKNFNRSCLTVWRWPRRVFTSNLSVAMCNAKAVLIYLAWCVVWQVTWQWKNSRFIMKSASLKVTNGFLLIWKWCIVGYHNFIQG